MPQEIKEKIIKDWEKEFDKMFDYNPEVWFFVKPKMVKSFIRQLLIQEEANWMAEIHEQKQKWVEENKKEPFKVKEDKRFTYYQCCEQIIGIGKKMAKGMKIGEILCGKCGRRIY